MPQYCYGLSLLPPLVGGLLQAPLAVVAVVLLRLLLVFAVAVFVGFNSRDLLFESRDLRLNLACAINLVAIHLVAHISDKSR